MKKKIMLFLALLIGGGAGHAAGLPLTTSRLSMELEYELMDECVGDRKDVYKVFAINICACTLRLTIEDGWWPDYDKDEDYQEDQDGFMRSFRKNREKCQAR